MDEYKYSNAKDFTACFKKFLISIIKSRQKRLGSSNEPNLNYYGYQQYFTNYIENGTDSNRGRKAAMVICICSFIGASIGSILISSKVLDIAKQHAERKNNYINIIKY